MMYAWKEHEAESTPCLNNIWAKALRIGRKEVSDVGEEWNFNWVLDAVGRFLKN